jgi:antitoxin component of RelBE/YafQ-DinJ toxin-antitoxin module
MKYPMINVRCSAEEKAAFHAVASERGMTVSEFARSLLRQHVPAQPPATASGGASTPDAKG